MSVQNDIVAFVEKYTYENGRGCPKGVLIHVGGFKAKDILAVVDAGLLESGRGSEGGLFPAGCKPSPKVAVNISLKSRMADYLRTLTDDSVALALVAEYDAELARRSESQN